MSTITSPTKPATLAPRFDAIPDPLRAMPWVVWTWTPTPSKTPGSFDWTKPPRDAKTGRAASTTEATTWSDFATACAASAAGGLDGIGVVLTGTAGLVGVDLDDVRDPVSGALLDWARNLVTQVSSYTEISPSGCGLRLFVHGSWPSDRHIRPMPGGGKIEVYGGDSARYLTVTGARLDGTPGLIEARDAELAALHCEHFGPVARVNGRPTPPATTAPDADVLARARAAANGEKFSALYDRGDWVGLGYPSSSEGDAALLELLLFWTADDPVHAERLFWLSALGQRRHPKLDRADYLTRTMDFVLGQRQARASGTAPPRDDPPPAPPAPPLVLPAGFVLDYVTMAEERTDAARASHALAAVLVLSALAGPSIRLPLAHKVHGDRLVLWGMNVVDSTGGRKTTVNGLAMDLIREVLGEEIALPWKGSPEHFIQAMAALDGRAAVLERDEFPSLLAATRKGYAAGLAQDFIRAFDGRPLTMGRTAKLNKKTGLRVDDSDRASNPYLVQIAASTRSLLVETATIDDVLTGLLARFTFTSGTAAGRGMVESTPGMLACWRNIVDRARGFAQRAAATTRLHLAPAVLVLEAELEAQWKTLALGESRPDAAQPMLKRLAETVLKVAALLAIDRATTSTPTVTEVDFADALALAHPWLQTARSLLNDLGRSRFQAGADAMLASITANPGIMRSTLFRSHRAYKEKEFDEFLNALIAQGLIHMGTSQGSKGPAARRYWPGTEGGDG